MNHPPAQALIFQCAGEQLVGILHPTASRRRAAGVLIIVGGPQYRVGSHRQFVLISRALALRGYPVMRFDYRGMGDSTGTSRSFENAADDIRAAIDAFVSAVPDLPGVVLWGLCDAASAALMHGTDDPRVCGIVLANPWVRTPGGEAKAYVQQYYAGRLFQRSFWEKLLTGRLNVLQSVKSFLSTLRAARTRQSASRERGSFFIDRMLYGLQRFSGRVLVLISARDLTAKEFTTLCREDPAWRAAISRLTVESVTIANADHTFSGQRALDTAVAQCAEWLQRIDPPAAGSQATTQR